jgi:hypothetical protein
MVFSEGDSFRTLRRPGNDSAAFRSLVRLPSTPPTDSVITDGLVGWYRFEDGDARDYTAELGVGSDQTAFDGTVNGPAFQPANGVTDFQNGGGSGTFDFDGSDDDIVISDTPARNLPVTLMGWVKSLQGSSGSIGAEENGFNNMLSLRIAFGNPGVLFFSRGSKGQTDIQFNDARVVKSEEFFHVAGVDDGTNTSLFINGQKKATGSSGGKKSSMQNTIGSRADGNFFKGLIDDVRFYDRALSQSEIQTIFNNTKP